MERVLDRILCIVNKQSHIWVGKIVQPDKIMSVFTNFVVRSIACPMMFDDSSLVKSRR